MEIIDIISLGKNKIKEMNLIQNGDNSKLDDEKTEIETLSKNLIYNIISQFEFKQNYLQLNLVDKQHSCYIKPVGINIINSRTKEESSHTLNLVKVFHQNGTALCGFHCLFNIVHFLRYFKHKNDKITLNSPNYAQYYLSKMNSEVKFWRFYKKVVHYLMNNMYMDDPAKKSLKTEGPLERYQFKFLLEQNEKIKKKVSSDKNNEIHFFRFFFGFNIIQGMDKTEIVHLQEALEKLKFRDNSDKKNVVYVILLGIVNHWSVFIVTKEYQKPIEYFYLDSHNINVFNFDSHEEIVKYVERRLDEKSKMFKKEISAWSRQCLIQWIQDLNFTIRAFIKVLTIEEKKTRRSAIDFSLYDIMVEEILSRVISTFMSYNAFKSLELTEIDRKLESEKIEDLYDRLYTWLKTEYHPKVLYGDVVKTIEVFNYKKRLQTHLPEYTSQLNGLIYFSLKIQDKLGVTNLYTISSKYASDPKYVLIIRFLVFIDHLRTQTGL